MVELQGEMTSYGEVYDYSLSQSYDGTFTGTVRFDMKKDTNGDGNLDELHRFMVDYKIETGPDGSYVSFELDDAQYNGPETDGRVRVSVDPENGEHAEIGRLAQRTVGDIKARANY